MGKSFLTFSDQVKDFGQLASQPELVLLLQHTMMDLFSIASQGNIDLGLELTLSGFSPQSGNELSEVDTSEGSYRTHPEVGACAQSPHGSENL